MVNHPFFAVTGADGTFSLPGLPPGTYTVEVWHEAGGTQSRHGDGDRAGHGRLWPSAFKAPTT